ncbi:hypothetical protein ABIB56_001102 [Glaciihabitans sp. UYNi722]
MRVFTRSRSPSADLIIRNLALVIGRGLDTGESPEASCSRFTCGEICVGKTGSRGRDRIGGCRKPSCCAPLQAGDEHPVETAAHAALGHCAFCRRGRCDRLHQRIRLSAGCCVPEAHSGAGGAGERDQRLFLHDGRFVGGLHPWAHSDRRGDRLHGRLRRAAVDHVEPGRRGQPRQVLQRHLHPQTREGDRAGLRSGGLRADLARPAVPAVEVHGAVQELRRRARQRRCRRWKRMVSGQRRVSRLLP